MDNDCKLVLNEIIRLCEQQKNNGSISFTFLSSKLSLNSDSAARAVSSLEKDGYIMIRQPTPKVKLIRPSRKGYEEVNAWGEQKSAKDHGKKILSVGKIIAGSFVAAILGLLWWWLGLSTHGIEPLGSSLAPFKIYDQTTSSILRQTGGPYYNTVNVNLSQDEYPNPDDSITATLNGRFSLQFDIESKAQNHQVNIQSIDVQLVRDSPPGITDIYQGFHGLGGGAVREFEIPLTATTNLPPGGSVLAHAQLIINDKSVDYIYLRPGERETIRIIIDLAQPGRYKVTPIINYALQEKNSSQRTGTSVVYYPENYRYWDSIYNTSSQSSIFLPAGNIILDTQNMEFKYATPVSYSKQPCLSQSKWIAFVARLSSDDLRLFVFQTSDGNLQMLTPFDEVPHILGWDNSGSLYFLEDHYDYDTKETTTDFKKWSSDIGSISVKKEDIPSDLITYPRYDPLCDNSQGWCLKSVLQDTNHDGVVGTGDFKQIVLTDGSGNILRRLGNSNVSESDPLFSTSKAKVVFTEGFACTSDDPGRLFVVDINGNNLKQITSFPSDNRSVTWSPDGNLIAYAANRSSDATGNATCNYSSDKIYIYNLQTGLETNLTQGSRLDTIFGWSADSQWILAGGDTLSIVNQSGSCNQVLLSRFYEEQNNFIINPSFVEASMEP